MMLTRAGKLRLKVPRDKRKMPRIPKLLTLRLIQLEAQRNLQVPHKCWFSQLSTTLTRGVSPLARNTRVILSHWAGHSKRLARKLQVKCPVRETMNKAKVVEERSSWIISRLNAIGLSHPRLPLTRKCLTSAKTKKISRSKTWRSGRNDSRVMARRAQTPKYPT